MYFMAKKYFSCSNLYLKLSVRKKSVELDLYVETDTEN